ncbi:MAG: hypothetical protein QOE23_2852 [Pseudonocardiales bacterium]|jgi:hypothetical protein|nr:hypothetical protein [Pseudonocardiales bacterium]
MAMVLMIIGAAVMLAMFCALAWWTRKSERDISYDKPGISEEQANALRFGIAVSVNQSVTGGL